MNLKTSAITTLSALLLLILASWTTDTAVSKSKSGYKFYAFNQDSFQGKVIVLHFWASWSRASRSENKNLLRISQKYEKNSKLIVAGVSLDTDSSAWKLALAEDGLGYLHQYCDFKKYESEVVKKYNIKTIPAMLLIDSKGNVVARASKMSELEASIEGLLK